jgi:lysophospholipase L1-like esterase
MRDLKLNPIAVMNRISDIVKRRVGGVLVAVVMLLVCLGAAEGGLRLMVKKPQGYYMLFPGTRVFEPDSRFIHGITGPARYEVNPGGFRGRDFGPDSSEFRILLVGGSTTECTLLDVDEHWATIAEKQLKMRDGRALWVGNVGRSGLTGRDHALTLKYLLQQYPRIDMVVVLLGVNNLTVALRQGDNYVVPPPITDPAAEKRQMRNTFVMSPEGLHRPMSDGYTVERENWYESIRLYDLARRAKTGRKAKQIVNAVGGSQLGQWREHRRNASRMIDEMPDMDKPLLEFRSNLETIVDIAEENRATLLFMTQPSLYKYDITPAEEKLLWLGGTGPFQDVPGQAYYTVRVLTDALNRYNTTALETCEAHGLRCLDLANAVPKDTTMLYDDVHFTEKGSALVGRLVAEHLRASFPDLFVAPTGVQPQSR